MQPAANRLHRLIALVLLGLTVAQPAPAAPDSATETGGGPSATAAAAREPYAPVIAPASNEPELALRSIDLPPGIQIELAAAEPQLANPVAFCFDRQGRIYVAETYRQDGLRGVEDNRAHMDWLDDDLAARTVDDRRAYLEKHLGEKIELMTQHHDRIRQLRDTDGDGKYETATVFADGFNDVLDGTGAGVLSIGGDIWYTCIPNLWKLRDRDGDGKADEREVLYHGFGVRFAFRGHDLHGLVRGPDGRIYFSVGDRGYHVATEDGVLANPESGAVFRCEVDGSDLQVFATGLRNPQELAFNKYGDLFTGDNNSDSGDKARWVHIVQGSDSGWRMAYQYLPDRGPFNREKIWHPYHDGQPAYIVPPIANVGDGPSGLVYYPGTGLSDEYDDTFFLCDFRGTPAQSGVRAIKQRPHGATYELISADPFIWSILATDCEFSPDGAFHILDWVSGWTGVGKGRIYRATSTDPSPEAAKQAAELLAGKTGERSDADLAALLGHPNMRVRLQAQFALAEQGQFETLRQVARGEGPLLARLHAVWGLGQLARTGDGTFRAEAAQTLTALLADEQEEVRAQAARTASDLGELQDAVSGAARSAVLKQLQRESAPRVLRELAFTAGRLRLVAALPSLLAILERTNDDDPVLRHAVVMGLGGSQSPSALAAAAEGASPPERLGLVLALRRLGSPLAAQFLADSQATIANEAARAIYDVPIPDAMEDLARTLDGRFVVSEPFIRRALAANYRLGGSDGARRIARLAASRNVRSELRLEALRMLRDWADPSPRDWILGMWRPIGPRDSREAVEALEPALPAVIAGNREHRAQALAVAARLGVAAAGEPLLELLADPSQSARDRSEVLFALAGLGKPIQLQGVQIGLQADEPQVRAAALELLPRLDPQSAFAPLSAALHGNSIPEKQAALKGLARLSDPRADLLLLEWLDHYAAGKVEPAVQLDLLEAAAARKDRQVQRRLARIESHLAAQDPLAAYAVALEGGDAAAGEDIFLNKTAVSCSRCHALEGGDERVGPNLADIGNQRTRRELLEALLEPNQTIAKGFETAVLTLDTGKTVTGIVLDESNGVIRLVDDQREEFAVSADSVEERYQGQSAMPDDVARQLTRGEIRDLVEFLASLKSGSGKDR